MAWTRPLKGVETLDGGVTAPERWAADPRLSEIGGVIHLAALVRHRREDADEVYFVNVEGTRAMVRIAAAFEAAGHKMDRGDGKKCIEATGNKMYRGDRQMCI